MSLFFCFYFFSSAKAITISPIRYDDLKFEPGKKISQTLYIYNEEPIAEVFSFEAQNFIAGKDGVSPEFVEDNRVGLASWIQFSKSKLEIGPDQTAEITFTISVPQSAEPGGYYAAVFLVKESQIDEKNNPVSQRQRLGALILGTVPGEALQALAVKEFNPVPQKKVFSFLPDNFSVELQNSGSIHFRPQVKIAVTNIFGREKKVIELNSDNSYLLPQSIRDFENKKSLIKEQYSFFDNLKLEVKNFAIGKYSANLSVITENKDLKFNQTFSFWVFPWRLFLTFLLIAIFLLLYNKALVKNFLKK